MKTELWQGRDRGCGSKIKMEYRKSNIKVPLITIFSGTTILVEHTDGRSNKSDLDLFRGFGHVQS